MSAPLSPAPAPGGFWRRIAAWIIDQWLVWVATSAVDVVWAVANEAHLLANGPAATLSGLTQVVVTALYFSICWTWRGQTAGYVLLRLRLERPDGGRVGFGRALGRWALMDLSVVLLLIPALISAVLVALPGRKRALHDLLAGTAVVRVVSERAPVSGLEPTAL